MRKNKSETSQNSIFFPAEFFHCIHRDTIHTEIMPEVV